MLRLNARTLALRPRASRSVVTAWLALAGALALTPCAATAAAEAAVTTAPANLVANGGFEDAPVNEARAGAAADRPFVFSSVVGLSNAALTSDTPHTGAWAYRIDAPAGGVAYLHTASFAVRPGLLYEASVWAKGAGSLRLEWFWWKRHGVDAEASFRARTTGEAQRVGGDWRRFELRSPCPQDATRAYLRVMAIGGAMTLDDLGAAALE